MNFASRNLLINLKNSSIVNLEKIVLTYSKDSLQILQILYSQGYIQSYNFDQNNQLTVVLRYMYNKPVFRYLKIFSKRVNSKNISLKHLSKISNKKINFFISTSKGIFNLFDCKKIQLGGKTFFILK